MTCSCHNICERISVKGRYPIPYCAKCECRIPDDALIGNDLCPCCKLMVRRTPKLPHDERIHLRWKEVKRY